ncbi:hypothetical protein R0135_08455 [Congregibacter variabilis]|uniref:Secreted protein n=1 Tax=Congregibacter variabilis TaxID=3081200 RepID=A0ABZ0IAU6_9GAMM|nr:hypothetical protein R0135_08455 [Congregibacter sp. IMCC43200]
MFRVFLILVLLGMPPVSAASKNSKTLERCFYLQEKIERYTHLRRGGGSHTQMASWRKSRSRYEDEFRALRCSKFSHQLRRKKR